MSKKIVVVNAGPRKGWVTFFPEECKKAYEIGAALAR